ncbi:MAG: hypothetical protein VB025_09150 [Sphaerochaeta sp.]|nr:hypothetical protein [Sphaerochaeta sp.]
MSDLVKVAVITGVITLVNGPLVIGLLARKSRKDDEVRKLRGDVAKLFKLVDRIAEGLTYGLENDAVIFNAFRKNSINGESEVQEQKMRDYFSRCATEGFKSGKEG